ncbi:hypothetical protein [Burkholderia latens]|uniref:Uncharacterized protein n=1 Tax=Burkholderia latens TaxID=488446 RepID=A0A6H9TPJ3_9BURK|nr:hypothetical protein [Burkholderia latens]KAB0642308.1 hypothetical protein F7R21_12305 [Burkholderia latens]VWB68065.1 hypothetical protein BLA24064_03177 [Burkholderia latens]
MILPSLLGAMSDEPDEPSARRPGAVAQCPRGQPDSYVIRQVSALHRANRAGTTPQLHHSAEIA